MLKELLVRSSFLVIMFALYVLGDFLTNCITVTANIEFRYILPIISLVFHEYYLDLFSQCMLDIKLLKDSIRPERDDENKISNIDVELKLSYRGSKSFALRVRDVRIETDDHIDVNIKPILVCEGKNYDPPEKFNCIFDKSNNARNLIVKCEFKRTYPNEKYYLKFKYLSNDKKRSKCLNINLQSLCNV